MNASGRALIAEFLERSLARNRASSTLTSITDKIRMIDHPVPWWTIPLDELPRDGRTRKVPRLHWSMTRAETVCDQTPMRCFGKRRHSFCEFHSEFFKEEGPAVDGFVDDYRCRFAGAVTSFGLDSN